MKIEPLSLPPVDSTVTEMALDTVEASVGLIRDAFHPGDIPMTAFMPAESHALLVALARAETRPDLDHLTDGAVVPREETERP